LDVIITGIALPPRRLYGNSRLAANELVYLASKALKKYQGTRVISPLEPGWDQALAKAALELKLPYTVALPYKGRDNGMTTGARINYYELLSRADEVYIISENESSSTLYDCRCWQLDQSDMGLVLWDYNFYDDVFLSIKYGLDHRKTINNLWQDWQVLSGLRQTNKQSYQPQKTGAQVF
jgi:uncharacterized phage-like protein YoqJ